MLGPTGGAEKPKKSHFRTHFPNPSGHTLSQFVGFAAFPGLAVSAHPRGPVRGGVVSGGGVTGTRWTVGRGGRIRRGRVVPGPSNSGSGSNGNGHTGACHIRGIDVVTLHYAGAALEQLTEVFDAIGTILLHHDRGERPRDCLC